MMMRTHRPRRGAAAMALVSVLSATSCGSGSEPPASSPASGHPPSLAESGDIAFARFDPGDAPDGLVPFVPLVVLRPGDRVRPLGAAAAFRSTPAWSPDGTELAYVGRDGLEAIDLDGGRRVVAPCAPPACIGIGPPTWSPDGRLLAFAADLGATTGLWTVPASGGEPSPLLEDVEITGTPSFAPDARTVAVIVDRGAADELAIVDIGTGEIVDRIDPEGFRFGETAAWSPDGTTLAVAGLVVGGAEGIYLMRPDGSGVRLLTSCPDEGCVDVGPAWSPDGSTVVFTRGRCDEPGSDCFEGDLFTIPADGGHARELTDGPQLDCCPAWQPVP